LAGFGKHPWEKFVGKGTYAVNISQNRILWTSPYTWKFVEMPEMECDTRNKILKVKINVNEMRAKRGKVYQPYKKEIMKGKIRIKNNPEINDPVYIFRGEQKK
jgi:hypothetical protein